jgi:hypothetical protein
LAENAAYRRRKSGNTAAVNFTKKQIDSKNLSYHLQMGYFYRKNHKLAQALKHYVKALPFVSLLHHTK